MTKERKNFQESKEGHTYMMLRNEELITRRLMGDLIRGQKDRNKWNIEIKRVTKKIKLNPMDDYDTDYIDIDRLLWLYLEHYLYIKADKQRKMLIRFNRRLKDLDNMNSLNPEFVNNILEAKDLQYKKSTSLLQYGGDINQMRALIYALMCGTNSFDVTELEL